MGVHGEVTLVLGGTRSGKSEWAERLAAGATGLTPHPVTSHSVTSHPVTSHPVTPHPVTSHSVTYVATGAPGEGAEGADPQWQARVAAHRARRPAAWATVEVPAGGDLGAVLADAGGTALVDSLGTWLAGFPDFSCPAERLCDALDRRAAAGRATVVVSEEVGLGVHPPTEVGRRFADALGALNQAVAAVSDRVLLVVAGRALELPRRLDSLGQEPAG